jgi:hypothetical protein
MRTLFGRPLKTMDKLIKKGVDINFIIPEYDVFFRIQDLVDANIDGNNVAILQGHSHISPVRQGGGLAEAMKFFEGGEKN